MCPQNLKKYATFIKTYFNLVCVWRKLEKNKLQNIMWCIGEVVFLQRKFGSGLDDYGGKIDESASG